MDNEDENNENPDERSIAVLGVKVGAGKPSFFDLENLQKRSRAARLPCLDKEGHYFPEECYYISRVGKRSIPDKDLLARRRSMGMANTWTDYRGRRHTKAEEFRSNQDEADYQPRQALSDYLPPEATADDWDLMDKDPCIHIPEFARQRCVVRLTEMR